MIMRCYSKAWDQHDLCIQRMHETEVLRLRDKCTFMQEKEFQELMDMNCIYYGGHKDTQGRPVVFVLLRNFNLKNISEEKFRRYACYLSDKFVRDMPTAVD